MPNRWTFKIPPISQLLESECGSGMFVKGQWVDPFAGHLSPAQITNDIDNRRNATSHLDALDFLSGLSDASADGVLYDPPYSITQARKYGKKDFAKQDYWKKVKNEIARVVKPGGKVICFGWNSMGLGKNRGFKIKSILLVPHGGSKNDTIVTVETKL